MSKAVDADFGLIKVISLEKISYKCIGGTNYTFDE
jgi:hypothetical protein